MTATAKTKAAPAAKAAEVEEKILDGKDAIYQKVNEYVMERYGKRIGRSGARDIFDLINGLIFAEAVKEGTFRFNGGFGSFSLKNYQSGSRRLPSGQEVKFGERTKLRYEEGVVTKELIKNGGDLDKVLAARKAEATAPAKPAKPAKAAPAAAKPAAAAPAKADDGSVELD